MDYVLPEEVGRSLVNYLAGQPYREVAEAIAALSSLKPVEEPKEEE